MREKALVVARDGSRGPPLNRSTPPLRHPQRVFANRIDQDLEQALVGDGFEQVAVGATADCRERAGERQALRQENKRTTTAQTAKCAVVIGVDVSHDHVVVIVGRQAQRQLSARAAVDDVAARLEGTLVSADELDIVVYDQNPRTRATCRTW